MRNRKNTTKQERLNLVSQFVASGQSQVSWCKDQGIASSTFCKWVSEYKSTSTEIKFVPFSPKKTTGLTTIHEPKSIENTVLMKTGLCKIYIPEKMAMVLIAQAMEVKLTDV